MRKNFIKIFLFSALLLGSTSCEDFLDISPESGVTKEEVFARLDNVKAYLKPVYTTHLKYAYPFYFGAGTRRTLEELTDAADSGNKDPPELYASEVSLMQMQRRLSVIPEIDLYFRLHLRQ